MQAHSLVARTSPLRLREARRHLLATGEVAEGVIEATLRRSWQRSQQFGLTRPPFGYQPQHALSQAA